MYITSTNLNVCVTHFTREAITVYGSIHLSNTIYAYKFTAIYINNIEFLTTCI